MIPIIKNKLKKLKELFTNKTKERERPFFPEIENLFSEFVEYIGGFVIEKLAENKVDRKNADYLFENPQIIAELKTFTKDVFSAEDDPNRLQELFTKWLKSGELSEDQLKNYAFNQKPLPQEIINEIIERASRPIERAIYKANKQIEETKKTFNKEDANGIIFIINDGNYFFSNEGFLNIIANLIGRKFKESSFDAIIYLTINQATRKPNSKLDYNFWIPIYTKVDEKGETIVSDDLHEFINKIGAVLHSEFLPLKTGYELQDHKQIESLEDSLKEIRKHKFIPKDVIYTKNK